MTTLPMQYYGRGTARIMMPRAVTRRARREWVVSPAFMILVISLTFFTIYKITLDEQLKVRSARTIIVLPNPPDIPKPTVEEKITFFKVVKDAARKSAEPRKKELKKVLAVPEPKPKKPVPPPIPVAKPVQQELPKIPPPVKKQLAPLVPRPELPLASSQEPRQRKLVPAPEKAKTPPPMPELSTPQLTAHVPKRAKEPLKKKEISLASPPAPVPTTPAQLNQSERQAVPLSTPAKRLAPAQPVASPTLKAKRPKAGPAVPPVAQPQKTFSPLPISEKASGIKANEPSSKHQPMIVASAPRKDGPAPALTQLSAPAPLATASADPMPAVGTPAPGASLGKPALQAAPSALHALPPSTAESMPAAGTRVPGASPGKPVLHAAPSALHALPPSTTENAEAAADINTLVQIQGSTLGQSLRVQNLKEEIYRKTRHMPADMSPYTYRIHHYQCTVVISDGPLPTAILTFEPSDAPFEVVSALERLLPRRTMQP